MSVGPYTFSWPCSVEKPDQCSGQSVKKSLDI